MENKELVELEKHAIPEQFPSLIKYITSKAVGDFHTNSNPQIDTITANGSEEGIDIDNHEVLLVQATEHHFSHSISISLPPSPSSFFAKQAKRVFNAEKNETFDERPKLADLNSQTVLSRNSLNTLARDIRDSVITETKTVPRLDRYFNNKLEEAELDALKKSENQPFLIRIPITCFGICLGVSSQAILWKTLATSPSTDFLHVSLDINIVLWCISLALIAIVSIFYVLKIIFYFESVRREYYHPIRVNFFFAPWIALLFLAIGAPPPVAVFLQYSSLWYVLMVPILCLELKIYGQWMLGGQRRLSTVANPSNHLSITGNFVGALLGSSMGLKEGPLFFFAVGLAHYTVLFVTLYQRLPTNETLPKELHPVFFLFVSAPSAACLAWENIMGDFYIGSRIMYFIAMFLYFSLAVRINFFRGFRFSLAWWAYTFPMTSASIATIKYATGVRNPLTQALSIALSSVATITVTALFLLTIFHGFVLRDLFTNDISLATGTSKKQSGDIEGCLSEEAS
ncbi:hypothetical protein J5N97_028065 [Dioscorea zingiberensis]|uniref:Uncharacterized protein n=1 Tax=Dioscorea zingiberensis TaxID=325984 RepID=A0A9D5H4H4_9LILI|nr:hypothetical protein J5N97_028065 [Dioscorea zingiberensis]